MSSTAIPTSTSVVESAVIKAPLSHVWHFIKRTSVCTRRDHARLCPSMLTGPTVNEFKSFWSALKSSEFTESQKETDVVKWSFKDGTVLEVKQEEHSVGSARLL